MRALAALIRALGLSQRSAIRPLAAARAPPSRMSARRDVQTRGENARRKMGARTSARAGAIGADGLDMPEPVAA